MMQNILVLLAFAASVFFIGRQVYISFFGKNVHCPGCSGCSTIDFNEIEKKMAEKYPA